MTRWITSRTGWFWVLAVLALAAGDLGCGRPNPGRGGPGGRGGRGGPNGADEGRQRREYSAPVGVEVLKRSEMNAYIETVGTVAPARSMPVKCEESGRIRFVKTWREGDRVEEGQILGRIDEEETSRSISMALDDLQTQQKQLELALARLQRNTLDFERAKVMFKLGQISRKAYEEREFQMESAGISYKESIIRVEKTSKQLENLRKQSERKVLRAPMTGYLVTASYVESRGNPTAADSAEQVTDLEGRLVGTGTAICGVVDMTDVLIRCDVTSKDIAKISTGQEVQAFVYSDGELEVDGEVVDVSPIMDVQTKAFKVDVEVSNEQGRLRPGMFARVNIITETHRDALVLDRKVVQRRNNEDIVFVVSEEDRAEKRVVTIGLENPEEVEITEGLRAGEHLVALGFETLQDKVKVRVVEKDGVAIEKKDQPTTQTTALTDDATTSTEGRGSQRRTGSGPMRETPSG